ncbi:Solute carrier organic anion transporter family member 1B1, partial [Orchesella cincta]
LKLSTETIGYIGTGNEISQMFLALILSYAGGKGHRPRWIALGLLSSSVAYLLYAMPHFLYGPGNEALSLTAEYFEKFHNTSDITTVISNKTALANFLKNLSVNDEKDLKAVTVCKPNGTIQSSSEFDCDLGDDSVIPTMLIFSGNFIAGIGSILFYTLAGPFIDDHMRPVKAPLIIAVTGSVRQAGPLIGWIVAYVCLRIYVSPTLTPLITNKDDRWLGAWWLGWVLYLVPMAFLAVLMSLFPRILRTTNKKKQTELNLDMNGANGPTITVQSDNELPKTEPIYQKCEKADLSFWASIKDLMANKINLWNNLGILCYGFAISGFGTYFPKYLEIVLKQNSADAALTTGASSIFFQVAGLLFSGFLISKYKLRARTLVTVNIAVGVFMVVVLISFPHLVCKQGQVVDPKTMSPSIFANYLSGANEFDSNLTWGNGTSHYGSGPGGEQLQQSCSSDCNCAKGQVTPVCYQDKQLMFYSACHAGCKSYDATNQLFAECSCLPSPDITLSLGKCVDASACYYTFVILIALMAMLRFGSSFGRIGNVLIPYRCVDRSQKSLASGLSFLMWSIVSIPSPIVYGRIIDSTCLLWGSKCGERGNCLLYDDVKFAYAMATTAAGLSLLGLACDCVMWYYVKDLKLYGEEENEEKK